MDVQFNTKERNISQKQNGQISDLLSWEIIRNGKVNKNIKYKLKYGK